MLKYLFILCLTSAAAVGQTISGNGMSGGTGVNLADHMMILDSKKVMNKEDAEPIDGTPYLTDEFQTGEVYTAKGVYSPVSIRYNIEGDYVEFKEKDKTFILDPRPDIRKVTFPDNSMVVENYILKGKKVRGFFILLDSGKVTLLKKKNMVLRPAQPPKGLETDVKPAHYEKQSDELLYKVNGSELTEVGSVKKMIESFPDHHEELAKFASKERISKNEGDLLKLVRYYNQL